MQKLSKLQWPEDFPDEPVMNILGMARSESVQVAAVVIIERIDREING